MNAIAEALIKRHEGTGPMRAGQFMPYVGARNGNINIGWGYNLSANGLPPEIAEELFQIKLAQATKICAEVFPGFAYFSEGRRAALLDMTYDLQDKIRDFHDMRTAIEAEDWPEAAHQCLNSDFGRELPERAKDDAALLENGS